MPSTLSRTGRNSQSLGMRNQGAVRYRWKPDILANDSMLSRRLFARFFIYFAAFLIIVLSFPALAAECQSPIKSVTIAELDQERIVTTSFTGSPPGFDSTPIVTAKITVDGGMTCVVVIFSAYLRTNDNHFVFQGTIDGKPLRGHRENLFDTGLPGVSTPDRSSSGLDQPRVISYTFYERMPQGDYVVEIFGAQCCSSGIASANTPISNAILTIMH